MFKRPGTRGLSAAIVSGTANAAAARDYVSIVGSSTVYRLPPWSPSSSARPPVQDPKIESTGSGGGLKLFCAGVGVEHPDITNASRRIKKSEQSCAPERRERDRRGQGRLRRYRPRSVEGGRAAESEPAGYLPGTGQK